jgi:hypothetical protein
MDMLVSLLRFENSPRVIESSLKMIHEIIIANPGYFSAQKLVEINRSVFKMTSVPELSYATRQILGNGTCTATIFSEARNLLTSRVGEQIDSSLLRTVTVLPDGIINLFSASYNSDDELMYRWPAVTNSIGAANPGGTIIEVMPVLLQTPRQVEAKLSDDNNQILQLEYTQAIQCVELLPNGKTVMRQVCLCESKYGRGYIANGIYTPFTVRPALLPLLPKPKKKHIVPWKTSNAQQNKQSQLAA